MGLPSWALMVVSSKYAINGKIKKSQKENLVAMLIYDKSVQINVAESLH